MAGTLLGIKDITVNKIDIYPCPCGTARAGMGEISKYVEKSTLFPVVMHVL